MNVETAKMSERGQIIIPKEIRKEINAQTNTIFVVSALNRDTIVMKKMDTHPLIKEFRKLRAQTAKVERESVEEEIHAYRRKSGA